MRNKICLSVLLITVMSISLSQDTTYVELPSGYIHIPYENSDQGVLLGDESSLQTISAPGWMNVEFNMSQEDWLTYVFISGVPEAVHAGDNELVIGVYNWDFDLNENVLWGVYIFMIQVEIPCCGDPNSCNYDPSQCDVENCLYEVLCFVDPCEVVSCEYYPEAECLADYCGGCFANFYMDGELVDCTVPPIDDIFLSWEYPDTIYEGSSENLLLLSMDNPMNTYEGYQMHFTVDPADQFDLSYVLPTERTNHLLTAWDYDMDTGIGAVIQFGMEAPIFAGDGPIAGIYFNAGMNGGNLAVAAADFLIRDASLNWLDASLPEPAWMMVLPCEITGDVNFDGNPDILDIVSIVNCIILDVPGDCPCSDVNSDGELNILDIIQLVNQILDNTLPEECLVEPDIGPCDGICPRYFYNPDTEECQMFMWGCCDGVVPFETLEECEETCD